MNTSSFVLPLVLALAACSAEHRDPPPTLAARTVLVLTDDGVGSGFLVQTLDGRRLIATAAHVVQASTEPWVEMTLPGDHGGYRVRVHARVVWADGDSDLALLSLEDEVPLARIATVEIAPHSGPAVPPLTLAGYSLDRVTGDLTQATEIAVSVTAWDVPVPLPDPLLGVRRTVAGATVSAPGAHRGNSGGPVIDGTGALVGIVVVGSEADGAIGLASPEPLRRALAGPLVRTAAAPTRDELAGAVERVTSVVRPAWTSIAAIDAGTGDRAALDQLPPAPELLPPSDLAAIRAGAVAVSDTAEGARAERELAMRAAAWSLDGLLAERPIEIVAIRRHGDDVVEADVASGGAMHALTFRHEHGRWQLSVRGSDGNPYPWEAAAAWAFQRGHGAWHADGEDGLAIDLTTTADGAAIRGVLRASRGELACLLPLTGRAPSDGDALTLTADSGSDGACARVTRVALDDAAAPTTTLHVEDDAGRHDVPVTRAAPR